MVGHARGNERMRELQENGAAPTGNHDDLAIDLPGDGARIQPDRARAGEPRANRRAMPVEGRGSGGHPGIVALAGEGRPEAGGATAFAENQPPDAADGAILEWRLSELYWITEGVRPFITDAVPYSINNDGAASAAAAAVLFANCTDAAPGQDAIHVLEAGAGTALFARYLLDEFRDLCRRHGRDFYDRLVFHVTDRSAHSVQQWSACGVLAEHGAHVTTTVCDAETPAPAIERPLRAVFANYVFDSLPAAVLRRTGETWQQLCARATVRADVANAMGFTPTIPNGASSAARSAPMLALPKTWMPSLSAHRISLCETAGWRSK
jgi:hypothetical protein